ncbi:MAG: SDR family NAD(P)-dependent oxidoreductase [Phyllobacteriaceae bacterium]|nr:SDR family NAD(P)-dependent oxidoreductase [Phyllobacteriaceae bacterium]
MGDSDSGTGLGPAIVTGGSSGIGLAAATRLARRGHPVVLIARRTEPLAEAAEAIREAVPGACVAARALDVRDAAALARVVDETAAVHGPIAWLVASAGVVEPGLFVEQPLDSHRAQLEVNYLGTLHAVRAVVPSMRAAGRGRVVLVSSGAGLFGIYGYSAYAPSKFAVRGLAEVLRVELAEHGIAVTLVCPPDTDTPQLAAETAARPAATAAIAAGGGVWSADAVAEAMLAAATRGRFLVAPGATLGLLARFHSLIGPLLRLHQARVVRSLARRRSR